MTQRVQVIIASRLKDGTDPEEAIRRLAHYTGTDEERVRAFLSQGLERVLVRETSQDKANRHLRALCEMGWEVRTLALDEEGGPVAAGPVVEEQPKAQVRPEPTAPEPEPSPAPTAPPEAEALPEGWREEDEFEEIIGPLHRPAMRGLAWLRAGGRLVRRSRAGWMGAFALFALPLLLLALIPGPGTLLALLLAPLVLAGFMNASLIQAGSGCFLVAAVREEFAVKSMTYLAIGLCLALGLALALTMAALLTGGLVLAGQLMGSLPPMTVKWAMGLSTAQGGIFAAILLLQALVLALPVLLACWLAPPLVLIT
jgi:hypothetical protein